jgi:hypothetical protein
MKYKIYKENDLYLIYNAYGEVVASCTNEKTANYLLSLLTPVNDNRTGLESPIAQKTRELLGKGKQHGI